MLLSFVNMHLRDDGITPDEFCERFGITRNELDQRLAEAGFEWNEEQNRYW